MIMHRDKFDNDKASLDADLSVNSHLRDVLECARKLARYHINNIDSDYIKESIEESFNTKTGCYITRWKIPSFDDGLGHGMAKLMFFPVTRDSDNYRLVATISFPDFQPNKYGKYADGDVEIDEIKSLDEWKTEVQNFEIDLEDE